MSEFTTPPPRYRDDDRARIEAIKGRLLELERLKAEVESEDFRYRDEGGAGYATLMARNAAWGAIEANAPEDIRFLLERLGELL